MDLHRPDPASHTVETPSMPTDQPTPRPADEPITDPAWLTAARDRRTTSAAYRITQAQLAKDAAEADVHAGEN